MDTWPEKGIEFKVVVLTETEATERNVRSAGVGHTHPFVQLFL